MEMITHILRLKTDMIHWKILFKAIAIVLCSLAFFCGLVFLIAKNPYLLLAFALGLLIAIVYAILDDCNGGDNNNKEDDEKVHP